MNCAACGHTNPERAKFCLECGTPFAVRCASCGVELPPAAKFCLECGTRTATAPSAPAPPSADTRKVVTIVFADLVGSTALHERLDAESARRFMESYYAEMRGAVEGHGGTVTQLLGDGVKAVFGIPRVAEDDAIRAVRAAVAMQEAFRVLAEQQRDAVGKTGLRVAVNTGEVVANDATEIIGDPVNVAARLQEQGKDGDVVVGESAHRLVSALVTLELLGSFALKGRSEAVKAYRVVSLDRPAGAATAPFVGREEELERLASVYDTAISKPAAGLAVLVGSPGLGKSRLIDEFARRHAAAATVVHAHCGAEGGATFAPLSQALRELLGIEDGASVDALRATIEGAMSGEEPDRARIAGGIAALLSGSPASPEETFFVVRRMFGALAQTKPVMLVIDDLHWAEPLLLDLVEHLIQWGSGVALFVLIGARPELRDLRSSLVTPGGLAADVVTLHGLDAGAAMRLAANVIGASDLPAAVAAKVLATSEGNPLFVGELVRMLVQEGALTKEGDRWTIGANLASLEMPPTIHALLAARIERLRPEERTVLERAAVVGRHFSRSAVAALLPREAGDLDARLEALRRSELIERDTGWLLGEPVLRFHHVLIRDAAYRRLLKGTRAELHAQLADWIEAQVGDAAEHDETIGWHLEQAHQFLRELGPVRDDRKRLGERAAARLSAAGRRALARDDVPLAASLLGRAIDRLDAGDPARADLALDWCEALLAAGDVVPASAAITELGRFAASSERLRAWQTCFAGQHTVLTAPSALHATADAVAAAATELIALGDAAGEAKAHYVHALALSRLGKVGGCEAALDRALAAARRAGDRRRANTVLAIAPLAALWGPSPVTRASGRCLDVVRVLRITQGAPAVEAVALSCQGVLEALRGRTDAARRMIASARKLVEELGITQRLLEADVSAGLVELLEGDAPAAERNLRGAYEGLRDLGLGIDAARAAALLARALLGQDRVEDADALSHESEALAGDDLKAAIAWRGVRAEALARRGEHAAAVEFASEAVEIAAATDALLDHADARMALAAALRAAGRGRDADAEERRATELWEAKGATLLVERARRGATSVEPAAIAKEPRTHAATRRPVRANAVTARAPHVMAAFAARDLDAIAAGMADEYEAIHHPSGRVFDRDADLASWRKYMRTPDARLEIEPIAVLGASLALVRQTSSAGAIRGTAFDVGAYELRWIVLSETDADGRSRRNEVFADDRLGEAIARLYERYAERLPEGPERDRASARARSLGTMVSTPNDLDRVAAVLAPDFECVDHRHLGLWSGRGAEAWLEQMRAWRDVAADVTYGTREILALEPNAVLIRVLNAGTDCAGGGAYERLFLVIFVTGADGRLVRAEQFDADREADALARFEELAGGGESQPASDRFENAAARADRKLFDRFDARDWSGIEALAAPELVFDERRRMVRNSCGRDVWLEQFRVLFDVPASRFTTKLLATRGERLSLNLHCFAGEVAGGGGPLAMDDHLALHEVDRDGRIVAIVLFDLEDRDAAYAELDARWEAGEGREHAALVAFQRDFNAGLARRDWDAITACYAPDFVGDDHRLVSWGTLRGPAFVAAFQTMVALAPDVRLRWDYLRMAGRGLIAEAIWLGTRDGGVFESPFVPVSEFDAHGKILRTDFFDPHHLDRALARFEEIRANERRDPLAALAKPNAASAVLDRWQATYDLAFETGDWGAMRAICAPEFVFDDRRRLVLLSGDRDFMIASARERVAIDARPERRLLGTAGDRIVIENFLWSGGPPDGRFEIEYVCVDEVDESGLLTGIVIFDADDARDAQREAWARWAAIDPVAAAVVEPFSGVTDAWRDQDPSRLRAAFADDVVVEDHRRTGMGRIDGIDAYLASVVALWELAPVSRMEGGWHWPALDRHGAITLMRRTGSVPDGGGDFESEYLVLYLAARGRVTRIEIFELEDLDAALARFEALRPDPRGARLESRAQHGEPKTSEVDALAIPPNAATRARDPQRDAFLGAYTARVSSVGEQMRREAREETRHLPLDERLRRALEMGELAIEAYRAARQVDRATAIRAFEAERQRGRRPCRFLESAPE